MSSDKRVDEQVSLKIQLGISPKSGASFAQLYKRAQENTQLVVAACDAIKHLGEPDFVWRCPIVVDDEMYVLIIPIEPAPQLAMDFGGKRSRAALVRAREEALQAAIDITKDGVQAGAELVRVVAKTTDTSPDPRRELRHLELTKGVDTGPARRFLLQKREEFLASIEDFSTQFHSQSVRASQQVGEPVRVRVCLVPHASTTTFENCSVLEVSGNQVLEGITSGGRKEFRFAELEPWQRVAFAAAREAGTEFWMEAINRIGTCSLEYRPADVQQVEGWRQLHAIALVLLQAVQFKEQSESSNDELSGDAAVGN